MAVGNQHGRDARTKDVGDPALGGDEAEHAIGGRDQPPGKADPFRLVAVEQLVGRMAGQNRRQLPGKIDGVADSGVHALTAGGAVDMGRIAEQEGAALAEMLRHPVMDVIGRKPVHLLDVDLEVLDRPVADVFELERIGMVGALVAHGSDQAGSPFPARGKTARKSASSRSTCSSPLSGGPAASTSAT